jgi:peptidoglycan-N-acetylglucosamine deacetylase
MPAFDKTLYLTFDDGPTAGITSWVLDMLDQYHAKASFFCIGANVENNPELYSEIQTRGHAVGNHTFNHVNGWKSKTEDYGLDILNAGDLIISNLFRPPYGKMKPGQMRLVDDLGYKTVLWSVLTYDFDQNLDRELAWKNIKRHSKPGSILVFHDSNKAFENLKELLPRTLEHFSSQGYNFKKIEV